MNAVKIQTNCDEIAELVNELEWNQSQENGYFDIIEAIQGQMPDTYWEKDDTDPEWNVEVELPEDMAWIVSKFIEEQRGCECQ